MNVEATILGRDLVALRDAVARDVRRCSEREFDSEARAPSQVQDRSCVAAHAAPDPWSAILFVNRGVRPIRMDEAQAELARVHATEAGRLLREAALLRCSMRATDHACLGTTLERRTRRERLGGALAEWRQRSRAELALWRVDGFESPAVLRACLARPIADWEVAVALAQAALAIDPCDAGRLGLASAQIVAGECISATRALEALLDRDPEPDLSRAAVRALALADRCVEASRSSGRDEVAEA